MNDLHKDFYELECIDRRSGINRRSKDSHELIGADKRNCIDRRRGSDRRSTQRYQAKNFTFVKLWSNFDEDIGQLLDIGNGGLSFRYMSENEEPRIFSELGVFTKGHVIITRIPFKIISDIELDKGSASTPIIFRRMGVQFGHLSPNQEFELDQFLDNQVVRNA
jgi:hypothetical protein